MKVDPAVFEKMIPAEQVFEEMLHQAVSGAPVRTMIQSLLPQLRA